MLGQASYDAAIREMLRRRACELRDAYERRHHIRDGYFSNVPCNYATSVQWRSYRYWVSEWIVYCEDVHKEADR